MVAQTVNNIQSESEVFSLGTDYSDSGLGWFIIYGDDQVRKKVTIFVPKRKAAKFMEIQTTGF